LTSSRPGVKVEITKTERNIGRRIYKACGVWDD